MPSAPAVLTIAIASSALFDLEAADRIYRDQGLNAYRQHQREHEDEALRPGVAFPFIRRLLGLNRDLASLPLVRVVLISRNDPDTGVRIRNAVEHHRLRIECSAFTGGSPPYPYIDAFGADLFLSAHHHDVVEALALGYAAGTIMPGRYADDADADDQVRIAFDFDGVIGDGAGQLVYAQRGLNGFHAHERTLADQAVGPGPLHGLVQRIATLQERERVLQRADATYQPRVRTAIITARSAPADRRVITSLRAWGISVDEAFFIGDLPKERILRLFRPHIFFDDTLANVSASSGETPSVHVPCRLPDGEPTQPERVRPRPIQATAGT